MQFEAVFAAYYWLSENYCVFAGNGKETGYSAGRKRDECEVCERTVGERWEKGGGKVEERWGKGAPWARIGEGEKHPKFGG